MRYIYLILFISSVISIMSFLFSVTLVFKYVKRMKVKDFWYTFFVEAISPWKLFFMFIIPIIYIWGYV